MPDDDGQFARNRHGRDVIAATPCDALIKGPQRSGSADRLPRRLNQHGSGMNAALLTDPPVSRSALPGMMHGWVQAEIGDQPVGAWEPLGRPDRRHQPDRHHHVDARNGHEPLDLRVGERVARQLALDDSQIVRESVVLAQMPPKRIALVGRERLCQEPCPPPWPEQIGVRALRYEVGVQNRLDDSLQSRPLAHDLRASRYLPPQAKRMLVRYPDFRQEATRMKPERWVRFLRQFGGLAKVDSGSDYAASFSCSLSIA